MFIKHFCAKFGTRKMNGSCININLPTFMLDVKKNAYQLHKSFQGSKSFVKGRSHSKEQYGVIKKNGIPRLFLIKWCLHAIQN